MIQNLVSLVSRILFIGASILAVLALWEKLANLFGYTLIRIYSPWRLLEFSAIALFFVIALQLREIKKSLKTE